MWSLKFVSVFAVLALVSGSALKANLPGLQELLTIGHGGKPQTTCDQQAFQHNTVGLAGALNLASANFWNEPAVLQRNLNFIYGQTNNTDELTKTCNAFNNFYAGMGSINIQLCLGPLGFVRRGVSPEKAFAFDGVLRQNRFQCGAGYYITQYHKAKMLTCLANTMKNNLDKLMNATTAFRTNVQHDQLNACKSVGILQKTYSDTFANGACGQVDRQLAAYWACESQSNYISAQFPTCVYSNRCDYGTVLNGPKKYAKVNEHGELMIYIPPVWNKAPNGKLFQEPEKWI